MLLIKNGNIKTMTGPQIPNGQLLIDDGGKIAAVGENLTVPAGTQILDAGGRLVTPGCVEAHCHIGLDNKALRWEGADYNEVGDPITPHMRAIDGINPMDGYFDEQLALNEEEDSLRRWQVIDRTAGEEVAWEYNKETGGLPGKLPAPVHTAG